LHAEKQVQPAGILVIGTPVAWITLPASLPACASPPRERSQTSLISGSLSSAALRRAGRPASMIPSAMST
jgi:hypothetical protein